MKIACQSCQAKYTIADEKVLGKIVKIRCKKCGATIVINGNEQEGATQAFDAGAQQAGGGAGVYDYTAGGGGESWTVNVSDGDQRTMTTAEILEAFRAGVVNDDTYCWKDGMGDWLPLRDITELSSALAAGPQPSVHAHQSEAPPAQQHDDQPTQAGFSSLFGGQGGGGGQDAGASLFGGGAGAAAAAPAASAASSTTAARRAGGRGAGGADLFGSAATAGSEQDVMTGGDAAAGGGAGSMTGQRNENSVLFSLSALTANAPKEETPMAQGEGSGLIDIRALSSNMASQNNGPKKVDDIMNLGGGGAFSAALAAPVLAPAPADVHDLSVAQGQEQKKGNTGLIVAMVGGLLVFGLIIAGAIVYVMKPTTAATTTPTGTTTATTTPTDTATTATTTTAPTGTTSVAAIDTGTTAGTAKPTATATTGGNTHATTTNTGGNTTAATATVPTTTATAGGTGKCGCAASDFNCQMACSAGVKPTATATATAAGGSAPFDKGAALSSLSGIASSLGSCKKPDGPTGSGKVTVTFEPSGSVSKVEFIEGPFGGTAVGGCIAGKFRGAHIPAFSGGAVPANKSFVLN